MPARLRPARLGLALVLAAAVGCQSRLNMDAAYHVDAGTSKDVAIDAPRYDQTVNITINSDAPVAVYVYPQKDQAVVQEAIGKGKKPPQLLASKEGVENDTITVTVPAKEAAMITLEAGHKPANVKVKIVGK
jgi:hypothetical protein